MDFQERRHDTLQQTRLNDAHVLIDDIVVSLGHVGERRSARRWCFADLSVKVSEGVRFALSLNHFFTNGFRINGLTVYQRGVFGADAVVHLRIHRVLAYWVGGSIRGALFWTRRVNRKDASWVYVQSLDRLQFWFRLDAVHRVGIYVFFLVASAAGISGDGWERHEGDGSM